MRPPTPRSATAAAAAARWRRIPRRRPMRPTRRTTTRARRDAGGRDERATAADDTIRAGDDAEAAASASEMSGRQLLLRIHELSHALTDRELLCALPLPHPLLAHSAGKPAGALCLELSDASAEAALRGALGKLARVAAAPGDAAASAAAAAARSCCARSCPASPSFGGASAPPTPRSRASIARRHRRRPTPRHSRRSPSVGCCCRWRARRVTTRARRRPRRPRRGRGRDRRVAARGHRRRARHHRI